MIWMLQLVMVLEIYLRGALCHVREETSECFRVNGADYRGRQDRTAPVNGRPCLYWNQTRQHTYNTLKYPNGQWGLGNHNYCRNPDGDVQPWCYVSENEEGIYWKYCNIPSCSMPGYVGCFSDSGNPPALAGSSGTSTKLTVQVCIHFCRKKSYKFAGVEAGYACFCGNTVDLSTRERVSAVECDQVCFGKSSELCGGDGRIGIYDVSVGACEGNVTGASGVVYSPNFPDDYGADSNCTWNVRPQGAGSIRLDFRLFEVRDGNDRLELRDGYSQRVLASFDGQRHPPQRLIFHTDFLTVHFLSDEIVHAQGFALLFTGLRYNSSQAEEVRGTASFSQFYPTAADRLNSSYSTGKATTIAAWVMYTAAGVFAAVAIGILYHLRKRSCLYVPRKTTSGVLVIRRLRERCQCPPGEAWSVVYKHTRVVICSESGARDHHREYVCISQGYNNLSATNQSSLKSLISSS